MRIRHIDYRAFNEETASSLSLVGLPRMIDFSFLVSAASIIFFHVSTEVNETINPLMHMRPHDPAKYIFN